MKDCLCWYNYCWHLELSTLVLSSVTTLKHTNSFTHTRTLTYTHLLNSCWFSMQYIGLKKNFSSSVILIAVNNRVLVAAVINHNYNSLGITIKKIHIQKKNPKCFSSDISDVSATSSRSSISYTSSANIWKGHCV